MQKLYVKWLFSLCMLCICGCVIETNFQNDVPTSRQALEEQRGRPTRTYQTPSGKDVYEYENKERFQMDNDGQVTHHYRDPEGAEVELQYWLNRWKNQVYHFTPLEENASTLKTPLHYINYDNGESIVYDPSIHKVIRVIQEIDEKTETPGPQ